MANEFANASDKINSTPPIVRDNLDSARQFDQTDWLRVTQLTADRSGKSAAAANILSNFELIENLPPDRKKDLDVSQNNAPDLSRELNPTNPEDINDIYKTAEKMDNAVDRGMAQRDQETARALNLAIASGDSKAIAKALERFKGDPEGLKRFMTAYNETLSKSGSGLQGTVDGENVTFHTGNGRGVQVSTDGRVSVRDVTTHLNGPMIMGPQVHDANPSAEMRKLGSQVRFNTHIEHNVERSGSLNGVPPEWEDE